MLVTMFRLVLAVACMTVGFLGAGSVVSAERNEEPTGWDGCYRPTALPEEAEWPWQGSLGEHTAAQIEHGALRIADEGTGHGQLRLYSRSNWTDPEFGGVVEAELKVVSCSGPAGVVLLVADGQYEATLTFYPDRVELDQLGWAYPIDTTDRFHTYQVQIQGNGIQVWIDDRQVLDDPSLLKHPAYRGRNVVGFGSCSSAATGCALWRLVRYRSLVPVPDVVPGAEHVIIYKKPGVYACFPSLHMEDGSLYVSFGTRVRRSHIDGTGGSAQRVSHDGGRTWLATDRWPENPLYRRSDGGVAYARAYGWRYVPKGQEEQYRQKGLVVRDVRPGVVAYLSGAYAYLRRGGQPEGQRWEIDTPPQASLMNYNAAAECVTGKQVRLIAVYGNRRPGERSTSWVLRSEDEGESWTLLPVAAPIRLNDGSELGFTETALAVLPDGRVIAMMRPDPDSHGYLYQSFSSDHGRTWTPPEQTPIWGYPAHLLVLADGRLLCSYGYRRRPMGIRACLSSDGGRTWDIAHEFVLRADGQRSGSDLGYPISAQLADGTLITVYYHTTSDGITSVEATRWRIEH